MLKYLKAAFWISPSVKGLGNIPLNVVALICIAILGFGNAGFWLLGFGLEVLFLMGVATNVRFQHMVDILERSVTTTEVAEKRQQLVKQLSPDAQRQLAQLEGKCTRIIDLYQGDQSGEFLLDGQRDALARLQWAYLKLLLGQQNLTAMARTVTTQSLQQEIDGITGELQTSTLTPALRDSKTATLEILKRRLHNFETREEGLAEIASNLKRIEAQIDLALENATMHEQPVALSTNIDLASQQLQMDTSLYGVSGDTIADLDATFAPPSTPQMERHT